MEPVKFLESLAERFRKIELELSIHQYEDKLVALIFEHGFKSGFMHRTAVGSIFFEGGKFSCKITHNHFGNVLTLFAGVEGDFFSVAVSLSDEKDKII